MKTKNIFKTVALAMMMPAMLLTTACSNDDEAVNNENTATKGYALPVTINVSRQGDEGTTRASYNESTRKLEFSEGDQLFVKGVHVGGADNHFAGLLNYDAGTGSFSGTIYTQYGYSGTAQELFEATMTSVTAYLIPNGYGKYFDLENYYGDSYNDNITFDYHYAFADTKKLAVEQLSYEQGGYDKTNKRFVLNPYNAILNFTVTGLAASKDVEMVFNDGTTEFNHQISTNEYGTATFAIGVPGYVESYSAGTNLNTCNLSIDFKPITISDGSSKVLTAGKIYNITRAAAPAPAATDLSTINADYTASDGEILTGTLASNVKISIADGATVTLNNVTINGVNDSDYKWAGITCEGDATIILSGTNTVKGFYGDYPGIQAAAGKTLIINGTGSLTASSYGRGAGIGGARNFVCGDIEIQGGTITATSGDSGAGIGGGNNASCGNIEIQGGTITATSGGDYGAGIGGGYNASWGNITISGGNVTATGGNSGAGIGGGKRGTANVSCGNIIISGGTVTATGGENAAGIGGGRGNNNSYLSSCGTITITSGVTKVTATMGDGATNSIGAGKYGTCGTVTIGGNEGAITDSPYTYQP